jgi:hypothetical protein
MSRVAGGDRRRQARKGIQVSVLVKTVFAFSLERHSSGLIRGSVPGNVTAQSE